MTEVEDTKMRIAIFDGKLKNFVFWEEKFIARAYKKKFYDVLSQKVKAPRFGEDYNDTDMLPSEALQKDIDMSVLAYGELINAMDCAEDAGKTAFRLVYKMKCLEYPNGNAYLGLKTCKKNTSQPPKSKRENCSACFIRRNCMMEPLRTTLLLRWKLCEMI